MKTRPLVITMAAGSAQHAVEYEYEVLPEEIISLNPIKRRICYVNGQPRLKVLFDPLIASGRVRVRYPEWK